MTDVLPSIEGDAGPREAMPVIEALPDGSVAYSQGPAKLVVPVTKADDDLAGGICRGLLVGTAGTANIQDAGGNTRASVPLQQGYNPIACKQVRTGGTALDIWALY